MTTPLASAPPAADAPHPTPQPLNPTAVARSLDPAGPLAAKPAHLASQSSAAAQAPAQASSLEAAAPEHLLRKQSSVTPPDSPGAVMRKRSVDLRGQENPGSSSPANSRRRMSVVKSPWALDDATSIDQWAGMGIVSTPRRNSVYKPSKEQLQQQLLVHPHGRSANDLLLPDAELVQEEDQSLSSSDDEEEHDDDEPGTEAASAAGSEARQRHTDRSQLARDIEAMMALIPARILDQCMALAESSRLLDKAETLVLPMREEFEGAVLFSDISGFSKLAERLVEERRNVAERGLESAAEKLTNYVGISLHDMVKVISESGGDVIKFAGDAILAVFPSDRFGGKLEQATLICAQVAMKLSSLQLAAGKELLRVHSGVGCGRIAWYQVGYPFWHCFVAGAPVSCCRADGAGRG
jgi:class 3 adenylate cyclase